MPRLTGTGDFVVVKMGEHEWAVAGTTPTRYGVTVVERPVTLGGGGDAMDAVMIAKALNLLVKKGKK